MKYLVGVVIIVIVALAFGFMDGYRNRDRKKGD